MTPVFDWRPCLFHAASIASADLPRGKGALDGASIDRGCTDFLPGGDEGMTARLAGGNQQTGRHNSPSRVAITLHCS